MDTRARSQDRRDPRARRRRRQETRARVRRSKKILPRTKFGGGGPRSGGGGHRSLFANRVLPRPRIATRCSASPPRIARGRKITASEPRGQ
jgi:hypothetical protein